METGESLFERIGGMDAIEAIVDIYYSKVTNDSSISHYFKKITSPDETQKQKEFLAHAFGDTLQYSGVDLKEACEHLSISPDDFESMIGHLIDSLRDLNVSQSIIDEVYQLAQETKENVVLPLNPE